MNTASAASPTIGIDFGTSYSKMAWYNPKTHQAEVILNREGEPATPSVVYFGEQEPLVGRPALEMLEYEQERGRVISSIKRDLATLPVLALPGGRLVKPVEVAAEILRTLRHEAQERHFHQAITRAVITYPASFGPLEKDKLGEAAQLAGFQEVELLEEPVAAAMAYAQMGLRVGHYLLVYDLGGETFDLAVLTREEEGSFRIALEPQGLKRCGGDDFDEALYLHCERLAREKLGRPISLSGHRDLHFLTHCRDRKENLSQRERVLVRDLLEPGAVLFEYELDRTTFEGLIRPVLQETVRKTSALPEQAKTQGCPVDTLALMGGSARIPLVQRLLAQTLLVKPEQWHLQDVAVALGAAYYAQTRWDPEKQYRQALEEAWADKLLERKDMAHLYTVADCLGLSEEQVIRLEREALGDIFPTFRSLFDRFGKNW